MYKKSIKPGSIIQAVFFECISLKQVSRKIEKKKKDRLQIDRKIKFEEEIKIILKEKI